MNHDVGPDCGLVNAGATALVVNPQYVGRVGGLCSAPDEAGLFGPLRGYFSPEVRPSLHQDLSDVLPAVDGFGCEPFGLEEDVLLDLPLLSGVLLQWSSLEVEGVVCGHLET